MTEQLINNGERVCLESVFRTVDTATGALATLLDLAADCGDPAWVLLQSFPKISFIRWDGQLPNFDQVFQGRIFGKESEVRWIREGSEWSIWRFREATSGSASFTRRMRRYYLWGIVKDGDFREDRIPGVPKYEIGKTLVEDDRAYIEVAEYESTLEGDASLEELEAQLNQPRLAAHRFVFLDCGRDAVPTNEEDQ